MKVFRKKEERPLMKEGRQIMKVGNCDGDESKEEEKGGKLLINGQYTV